MPHVRIALFFSFLASSISGTAQDFTLPPDLVINEFMAVNFSFPDSEGGLNGWLELYNNSDNEINLGEYSILLDTAENLSFSLPDRSVKEAQYIRVFFSGKTDSADEIHAPFQLGDSIRSIALLKLDTKVDSLFFYYPPDANESLGRNPLRANEWIHFGTAQVSPAAANNEPGLWKKIANRTQYEPRDSSPNACLVFDNKVWVLAGFRYTGDSWESRSDVWSSNDGLFWQLINADPPFDPYSAFIVFKGKMWAFNASGAYSSHDGYTWINETPSGNLPVGYGARITVFKDELWFYNEGLIGKSADGVHWEIVLSDFPWEGENRIWPAFIAHNGKLIFFGGGSDYRTGKDHYYNDVWSSDDGLTWRQLTAKAPWPGRFWFCYTSFDNKLWLMGGWNYYEEDNEEYGNLNDVWISETGAEWMQLEDPAQWPNRHSPLAWVNNNALYVSSGYGGGGTGRMYNDVWVCEDKKDRLFNEILPIQDTITYGDEFTLQKSGNPSVEVSNEQVLRIEGSRLIAVNTGETKLKIATPGNKEYYPYVKERNLIVRPKNLIITIVDTTRFFDTENPIVRIQYDGVMFEDSPEIMSSVSINEIPQWAPVGKYDINAYYPEFKNYNVIVEPGVLTILPAGRIYPFPNPAHDKLQLVLMYRPEGGDFLEIYNTYGKLVLAENFAGSTDNIFRVPINLPEGLYLYRIKNGGTLHEGRLMIK